MGWGIVKPPLWLFLRRFLTRCETMTWHSARAAESVLRQGNRSEEMKREFPSSPWVRWVPVCGWLPRCVLLLCLLQVGRSDAPLRQVCVGASVFYPSSDGTLLKFTSVSSEREYDWKRERLHTRKKFTDRWRAAAGKCFWKTDGSSRKPAATALYQSGLLSLLELMPVCVDRVPKCVLVAHAVMHLISLRGHSWLIRQDVKFFFNKEL